MIEAPRSIDGKVQTFVHYFALSRRIKPAQLLRIKRAHWGTENHLHGPLDAVLDEDMSRTRKDNGPTNLSMLRRLALNMVRALKAKGFTRRQAAQVRLERRRARRDAQPYAIALAGPPITSWTGKSAHDALH